MIVYDLLADIVIGTNDDDGIADYLKSLTERKQKVTDNCKKVTRKGHRTNHLVRRPLEIEGDCNLKFPFVFPLRWVAIIFIISYPFIHSF